jgi:hypothetical protein
MPQLSRMSAQARAASARGRVPRPGVKTSVPLTWNDAALAAPASRKAASSWARVGLPGRPRLTLRRNAA